MTNALLPSRSQPWPKAAVRARWRKTTVERFWAKVDPCRTDGCALYLGNINRDGYGRFCCDGKIILAHHFLKGKPPAGLQADHVKGLGCTHRNCIWPEHLEFVTGLVNTRRSDAGKAAGAQQRAKTACPQGHSYSESNTYRDRRGCRACRECCRIRAQRDRDKPGYIDSRRRKREAAAA